MKTPFRLQKNMLIGHFEPRVRHVFRLSSSVRLRANPVFGPVREERDGSGQFSDTKEW